MGAPTSSIGHNKMLHKNDASNNKLHLLNTSYHRIDTRIDTRPAQARPRRAAAAAAAALALLFTGGKGSAAEQGERERRGGTSRCPPSPLLPPPQPVRPTSPLQPARPCLATIVSGPASCGNSYRSRQPRLSLSLRRRRYLTASTVATIASSSERPGRSSVDAHVDLRRVRRRALR